MNSRSGSPYRAPWHLQSSDFDDIADPDEPPDQSAPSYLRACGVAHDASDSDATSKERRPGRGLWRCSHGKHLPRTKHKSTGEVHGISLAGRISFTSVLLCAVFTTTI